MTVICWDGQTLAADRRCTSGSGVLATVTKIRRVTREGRTYLVGLSGARSHALDMLDWFVSGAGRDAFPKPTGDTGHMLVIADDGSLVEYDAGPTPITLLPVSRGHAIGSGSIEARVAMHCGRSAVEAVEIACLFDSMCGNGIDTLTFEDTP